MAISGAVAITTLALSVWRRSWSTWLVGFVLLLVSAGVAWMYRTAPQAPREDASAAVMHAPAIRPVSA